MNTPSIPGNHVPGDPAFASRVRWFVLAVILVTGGLFYWIWHHVEGAVVLAETDPAGAVATIYALAKQIALIMWITGLAALAWLGRFGWRILNHNQYPVPGARVMKATRIRNGSEATRLAWLAISAGLLAFGAALCAGLYILAIVSNFPPPR